MRIVQAAFPAGRARFSALPTKSPQTASNRFPPTPRGTRSPPRPSPAVVTPSLVTGRFCGTFCATFQVQLKPPQHRSNSPLTHPLRSHTPPGPTPHGCDPLPGVRKILWHILCHIPVFDRQVQFRPPRNHETVKNNDCIVIGVSIGSISCHFQQFFFRPQ